MKAGIHPDYKEVHPEKGRGHRQRQNIIRRLCEHILDRNGSQAL